MSEKNKRILPWKRNQEKHVKSSGFFKHEVKIGKSQHPLPSSKHIIFHSPSETLDFCLTPPKPKPK